MTSKPRGTDTPHERRLGPCELATWSSPQASQPAEGYALCKSATQRSMLNTASRARSRKPLGIFAMSKQTSGWKGCDGWSRLSVDVRSVYLDFWFLLLVHSLSILDFRTISSMSIGRLDQPTVRPW